MDDNLFDKSSKRPSFADAFKKKTRYGEPLPSRAGGSLKERFVSAGAAETGTSDAKPDDQSNDQSSEKSDTQKTGATQEEIEKIFSWQKNSARFPEELRPGLSEKSIKQLEKNYRELLMVEGNISVLNKEAKSVYVSSCFNNEGKTMAAVSTAYAMAAYSGHDVLLIDGNLDGPRIHELFGTDSAPGFSELCSGAAQPKDVVLPTIHRNLSIITAGSSTLDTSFGKSEIKTHLKDIGLHFDYIVCDGSSVMVSSEVSRTAKLFDALLLVVECEKTRWEVLQVAQEKIKKTGGPPIGIVFNRRKYYIPSLVYRLIAKKR